MALINMYLANQRKPLHKPEPLTEREKVILLTVVCMLCGFGGFGIFLFFNAR